LPAQSDPSPLPETMDEDTNGSPAEDSSASASGSSDGTAALADLPPELANHPLFRVVRELGRGGMGVVYLAEHRGMHTLVALKTTHGRRLDQPLALERYRREIKLAAELEHPNIVRALHAEQIGRLHLLVLEYVKGRNLAWVLRKYGQLPVRNACRYARQ